MDDELNLAIAISLSEAEAKATDRGAQPKRNESSQDVAFFSDAPIVPMVSHSSSSYRAQSNYFRDRSAKDAKQASAKSDAAKTKASDLDSDMDLALALKLQDEEEEEERVAKDQERRRNGTSSRGQDNSTYPTLLGQPSAILNDALNWFGIPFGGSSGPGEMDRDISSRAGRGANNPNGCFTCGQTLFGRYLIVRDRRYHRQCFRCARCSLPLEQSFVTNSADGLDGYYHPSCADELFTPTCILCSSKLRGEYFKHRFFKEGGYCKSHEETQKSCFACGRKEPLPCSGKEGFAHLPDSRCICMDCVQTAVVDSEEAKPLYLAAVDFMAHQLGLPVPEGMREVPVLAVDLPSLNEQRVNTDKEHHRGGSGQAKGITRGLTLKTRSEIRHFAPGNLQFNIMRGMLVSSGPPTVYRTEEVRDVTAVLVLAGLPADLTSSILAHEAMHVWCSLNKDMPFYLPPRVEEGLCQLVAFKYLQYMRNRDNSSRESSSTSGGGYARVLDYADWETKFRAFISNQIETDPCPVYGDGFRQAAKCCAELPLDVLLDYVKEAKDFPSIATSESI